MTATLALGWALVHFLWQGTALAILLGAALAITRSTAARARYALAIITLAAMLILPVATTVRLYEPTAVGMAAGSSPTEPRVAASPAPTALSATVHPLPQSNGAAVRFSLLADRLEPALPWLVVVWVLGVLILSVRLAYEWLAARRLRTRGTREVSAALQQVLARLVAQLRVTQPVRLLESWLVEVPAVVGWLRPVVLVPASAITGLTPQQLEVLLAHELAHVRRYDDLVNVLQCVIETLLFYHPAVWWVSRRIRDEREHCCDDLVVQVCGDPHLYASALVDMERLRPATPRLALAATGGSLLHRVSRLVLPAAARTELFPRWASGIAAVFAVTVALLTTGSHRVSGEPANLDAATVPDTTRMTPDTVLRHPDPSQPLAQRLEWARTEARQLGRRSYWVGYTIPQPPWLEHSVYVDRGMDVRGRNITISGRMFGDFQGLMFRGVRLAPLTGTNESDDIALLFEFVIDQSGKAVLSHVHIANFYLPMDFRGRTLIWLGPAVDAQSLPVVVSLFSATPQPKLREDLVSAIGIHGSSETVVPILIGLMSDREPSDVRSQAAEWLGFHPTPAAVNGLSAAARANASGDVRRQAAEGLGNNTLPAATDSVIAVARTADDADARRAAIEGLGQKDTDRALAALTSIAQTDGDEDVQRAAVEALGEMPSGRGLNAVRDLAQRHQRPDVRRAAVETLGENLEPAEAVKLLKDIATSDPSADVRREAVETLGERAPTAETVRFLATLASNAQEDAARAAVETLGEIGDLGLPAVIEIARTHPNADLRRAAVETIGDKAIPAQALDILAQIARGDDNSDVQRSAVETLGEMHDARALALVAAVARGNGNVDVRRAAIEAYTESARSDSALSLLKSILASNAPQDVYSAVLESLEEMDDGAGIPALIQAVRSHPNREVRADALRRLAESDDPRAQQIFDQTLRRP